jgi:hypothetical protein
MKAKDLAKILMSRGEVIILNKETVEEAANTNL